LHTANEPAITEREFRADQDQGRIFCRTLLPADAVLEKIGGPGKEFWADGRNYPIAVNSPHLKSHPVADNPNGVSESMGRWRVEVKPGVPRIDDVFLHLIQASDQTVAKMVESRVSENGQQIELTFTAGARTYTIGLNQTGEIGGHIRIEEDAKAIVDRELARDILPPEMKAK
jgi:heparin/heparan-sulfate lyase